MRGGATYVGADVGWVSDMGCRMSRIVGTFVVVAYILHPTSDIRAQDTKIRTQREELTRIRLERSNLEKQMLELRSTAHDLGEEVSNLNRRADATARLVRVL